MLTPTPFSQRLQRGVHHGAFKGATAEVRYQSEQLAPGLYALSWQEADKGTVVHVDDFEAGQSRSYYTTAGHDLVRMAGTLREVKAP